MMMQNMFHEALKLIQRSCEVRGKRKLILRTLRRENINSHVTTCQLWCLRFSFLSHFCDEFLTLCTCYQIGITIEYPNNNNNNNNWSYIYIYICIKSKKSP